MTAWSKARAFVRRNGKAELELAEATGMAIGWKLLARVFAVGVAAAAVGAPVMIDLSNNNGAGAASSISAYGVSAVEAKATEGIYFRDGDYPVFRAAAAKAKRAFGGYMFLRPDESGAAQADYFLAYARPRPGDLEPVVDSETGSPYSAASATYAALHELELKGYRPILYASSSYLGTLVSVDPRLKRFRVWDAEYGPRLHRVAGVTYAAWQNTDRARVAGRALDGSILFAPVSSLEIPLPAKPLTPSQRRVAALRARSGYWSWLAWYIGAGDWHGYGRMAPRVRPHVPRRVPGSWWKSERAFVRARG